MQPLDGSVLAGRLDGLFAFEPTTAQGQCHHCDDVGVLAEAVVYPHPMGFVVRCRRCESVLMVVVERGDRSSLSMRGLRWVRAAV
jgi:hypothetical protein